MSKSIDMLRIGNVAGSVRVLTKDITDLTAELTGANSEPVIAAGRAQAKEWRRLVSVAGHGEPSAPGQPPHAQKRRLQRSIGTAVVEGVRRVGSSLFTARLTEFGYTAQDGTTVPPRPHARVVMETSAKESTDVLVGEIQTRVSRGG
jgi:hypothetical protein